MGCHYKVDKIAGKVLIPGCMGTAAMGIDNCTCYSYNRRKLTPEELISELKNEIKELKIKLNAKK